MAEIKNSVILEEILKNAKTVGQKVNPTLTAERFIFSLMEAVEKADSKNDELTEAKSILSGTSSSVIYLILVRSRFTTLGSLLSFHAN